MSTNSTKDTSIKVSVLMIAYNHEAFIAQALNSVLMQKVDFDYEIVIGDDCSTDNTRKILIEYQKRNPDKIKLLLHERNLGFHGKGNLVETHNACLGQYIAILEGDDYWISPHKLQKQADFLDDNPQFAICFTATLAFYDDGSKAATIFPDLNYKKVSTLEDLLHGNFMHTCSVMFRNKLFSEYPKWFYEVTTADLALHIINAQYGKIGYINEVTSKYRIHKNGLWSIKSKKNIISKYESAIRLYSNLSTYLDPKYCYIINQGNFHFYEVLMAKHIDTYNFSDALKLFLKYIKSYNFNIRMTLKFLLMVIRKVISHLKRKVI